VDHEVSIRDGTVIVTTSGTAAVTGWTALHDAIVAHPGYTPGMPILVDHSALDTAAVSADDAREVGWVVKHYDDAEGRSPIAVVAPHSYGLSRVAQAELDDSRRPFRAFLTRDEADAWIASFASIE
jgi:hypothetical protein